MTAQLRERLLYNGDEWSMCAEPLSDYFKLAGERPSFAEQSTALWRRYVGVWEIVGDRLYLISLHARLEDGSNATLETVFPGFPDRVFAHWYSDELRLPQGRMVEYVHLGYGSKYEADLFLQFENGVLVGSRAVQNPGVPVPAEDDMPVRALTVLSRMRGSKN